MTTELATVSNATLQRFGSPEERQYLLEVMAGMLGIPAREISRPEVVAIIARAVEWSKQYGWQPGIHMHVQKYETPESKNRRKQDPGAIPEYDYQLTDGEKGWSDSAMRWRIEYGVRWKYQRKRMTPEELKYYCASIGMNHQDINQYAIGYWCRIIDLDVDDPKDPENPPWAAGVWSGKMKVGKWWNDDRLPTGADPQRVAIRRADKAAIMQSELSLLPVDTLTPEQRVEKLTEELRSEAKHIQASRQVPDTPASVIVEEDGNAIFASEHESTREKRSTQENVEDGEFTTVEESTQHEEVDFGMGKSTQETEDDFSPYASLMHNTDYKLSGDMIGMIELITGLHRESQRSMSQEGYDKLTDLMNEKGVLAAGETTTEDVRHMWEVLTQSNDWERPGMKCGKAMQAIVGTPDQAKVLLQLHGLVLMIANEMAD